MSTNMVGQTGPGQLVYTAPSEPTNNTQPVNIEQQKEIEMEEELKTNVENEDSRGNSPEEDSLEENHEGSNVKAIEEYRVGGDTETNPETIEEKTNNNEKPNKNDDELKKSSNDQFIIFLDEKNEFALKPDQIKGLNALLNASTIVDAARRSGVSERSLRRWLSDDEVFKKALHELSFREYELSSIRNIGRQEQAFKVVEDVLENPSQPGAAVRLKAAEMMFKRIDKCYEVMNTKAKIDRLRELEGEDV